MGGFGSLLMATTPPLFGPNLLPNAGFEEADAEGIPAGWKISGNTDKKVALGIALWAACRSYYFAFHVLEHWIDPGFRYRGLIDLAGYALRRRR